MSIARDTENFFFIFGCMCAISAATFIAIELATNTTTVVVTSAATSTLLATGAATVLPVLFFAPFILLPVILLAVALSNCTYSSSFPVTPCRQRMHFHSDAYLGSRNGHLHGHVNYPHRHGHGHGHAHESGQGQISHHAHSHPAP